MNCQLQVFSFYGYTGNSIYQTLGIKTDVGPQECFKVKVELINLFNPTNGMRADSAHTEEKLRVCHPF